MADDEMRDEYDFKGGMRGKFYRPDAKTKLPIYLDDDTQAFIRKIADEKNVELCDVVNELIRAEMRRRV